SDTRGSIGASRAAPPSLAGRPGLVQKARLCGRSLRCGGRVAAPPVSRPPSPGPSARDIRARRPALRMAQLYGRARRALSALALVALDLCGVGLALFLALVTAQLANSHTVLAGLIWRDVESRILPFIAVTVILVFAKDGLYRAREFRPTGSRVTASMFFVTV